MLLLSSTVQFDIIIRVQNYEPQHVMHFTNTCLNHVMGTLEQLCGTKITTKVAP